MGLAVNIAKIKYVDVERHRGMMAKLPYHGRY